MIRARQILYGVVGLAALALVLSGCGPTPSPTPVPEAAVAVATPPPADTPTPPLAPIATPPVVPTPTAMLVPAASPATATPTASAAADATPSVVSTSTATAVQAPESDDALVSALGDEAWEILVQLTEEFSPRESATAEEKAAADFLVEWFQAMDYQTELQPFTFEFLSRELPLLSLITPEEREIIGFPMTLSGTGQPTGVLGDVGLAFQEDIPAEGMEGKIALVHRGRTTFEEKVTRVAEAGALAAVVYNNEPGLFGGALMSQADIPAIAISQEDGVAIKELMDSGEVVATVSVIMTTLESRNVIAETPGASSEEGVVILGGHFDTVPDTQGANDNGSGVATLLTLARVYSEMSYPLTLQFIAFGAEEIGLFGSRHYVSSLSADELDDIVAMLNFDVPGSGEMIEVLGHADLVKEVLDYGEAHGIEVRRGVSTPGASSDHASFAAAGVPAVFFLADDLSRINSPADNIEFVQPELMGIAAALGLALLDSLAGR